MCIYPNHILTLVISPRCKWRELFSLKMHTQISWPWGNIYPNIILQRYDGKKLVTWMCMQISRTWEWTLTLLVPPYFVAWRFWGREGLGFNAHPNVLNKGRDENTWSKYNFAHVQAKICHEVYNKEALDGWEVDDDDDDDVIKQMIAKEGVECVLWWSYCYWCCCFIASYEPKRCSFVRLLFYYYYY